ncbi:MAG TPA: methanogenesis marker 17 protein [Candidatus Deferrimicrobium sp.]|nr:methanogenesis marker 17 protein [Candidatus Deferrimicrobium sp.]
MDEKIFVENVDQSDPFNYGILSYKIIADQVFTDLAISGGLRIIRVLIDIQKPFFYIWGLLNVTTTNIYVSDITTLSLEDEGIHVAIEDESYAPDLLRLLWSKFGRDKIIQIDRWNLIIPSNLITLDELKMLITVDPRERIMNKILDAFNRIIPEGFRVRKSSFDKDQITIIASENPLEVEWIQTAEDILKKPPTRIPEGYLEKLRRVPKKIAKRVVPWKTHEFQESI